MLCMLKICIFLNNHVFMTWKRVPTHELERVMFGRKRVQCISFFVQYSFYFGFDQLIWLIFILFFQIKYLLYFHYLFSIFWYFCAQFLIRNSPAFIEGQMVILQDYRTRHCSLTILFHYLSLWEFIIYHVWCWK